MEEQINGDEVTAQMLRMVDDTIDQEQRIQELEAELDALRVAAAAVVARFGAALAGNGARFAAAMTELKRVVEGVTVTEVPPLQWPPPVGTVVTYIDDDGEVWPDCVVRAHSSEGWSAGRVRLDNKHAAVSATRRCLAAARRRKHNQGRHALRPYKCLCCMNRWKKSELKTLPNDWESKMGDMMTLPEGACPECDNLVWHDDVALV